MAEATRHLILLGGALLPEEKRISLDRRLRGREEQRRIRAADYILMSWGKSGRTWLRVMLSRFYQQAYGMPDHSMLGFDNYHRRDSRIPSVLFTHGNYLRDYTGDWNTRTDFYDKKVVMLVRDPRDVAVSQYFQWKYRMRPVKKKINRYPTHGADVPVFDFVMNPNVGLPMIIDFFNIWAREIHKVAASTIVRYEDMRQDPQGAVSQVLEFLGTPGSEEQVKDAVDYAAYENMKKLEEKRKFRFSGARMTPGDTANPQSFKVRRAKVGGYRDYFDDAQIEQIEERVRTTMLPDFGYGGELQDQRQTGT
jgi:hypothetical protein